MKSIVFTAVIVLVAACSGKNSHDLAGTWNFVADQEIDNSGRVIKEDRDVRGQLIYTEDGYMSVHLLWIGRRQPIMSDSIAKYDGFPAGLGLGENTWTSEQRGVIIDTYDGYFGRYEVDWENGIVTHIADGDMRPQSELQYKRKFVLKGDTLFLRGVDLGLRWQVLWVRKK
jgi:hypothetical protein